MMMPSYIFKSKAVRALKGNWQTALLVTFFASLPSTILQILQTTRLPDVTQYLNDTSSVRLYAAIAAITPETWTLIGIVAVLAALITPILDVGLCNYLICRLRGKELGFVGGLFSRIKIAGKSIILHLLIGVKVFLWALLFIVPGIIAAMRYAMAPYFLAENPDISPLEALRKSKEVMKGQKATLFMLGLSFIGLLFAAMLAQAFLGGISIVLGMVASQFIQLYMSTYQNASIAGFYIAVSAPLGMQHAQQEAMQWMKSMGANPPFGNDDNDDDSMEEDAFRPDTGDAEPGAGTDEPDNEKQDDA